MMRVRSPRISEGYEESSRSDVQLAAFAHDSDVAVFLPRDATLSHEEEAKEGNAGANVDAVDKVAKVGVRIVDKAWHFLSQPFTWLSMLCR